MRRGLILLLVLAGCRDATSPLGVLGTWGSESIRLDVTLTGGSFAAPCLEGELSQPLLPDAAGRFEVAGTIIAVGGPPAGDPVPLSVTYRGVIDAGEMNLIIDRGAGSDEVILLRHHREPEVYGCPYR